MGNIKRPKSVTLIAWILIIVCSFYLANAIGEPKYWRSFAVVRFLILLWLVVSGFVGVVSGTAILKGFNWGRLLCLFYIPISIIAFVLLQTGFGFLSVSFHLLNIVRIAFYIIVLIFLTRPASLAFFAHGNSEE